jgi:thioredoxin reductase (NADPH)
MSTNVRGVFAAGDVTTGSNRFEQIVTAEAEGAIASESAYKYIRNLGK